MNINTKHMAKYKKLGSVTLFDAQTTKENLSELGNPLERLSQVIDFEMFRGALEEVRMVKNGLKVYMEINTHSIILSDRTNSTLLLFIK